MIKGIVAILLFWVCFSGVKASNNQIIHLLDKAVEERVAGSFDQALQFDLVALYLAKKDQNDSFGI